MNTFGKWMVLCVLGAAHTLGVCQDKKLSETESLVQSERARIARERETVQTLHRQSLAECQGKFAITDCEKKANRQRRKSLDELRRQELVLNTQERKQRAARQQARLDERARKREADQTQKKLDLSGQSQAKTELSGAAARKNQEEASEAKFRQKQDEAAQHKSKVEAAQARKSKPTASSLPIPN